MLDVLLHDLSAASGLNPFKRRVLGSRVDIPKSGVLKDPGILPEGPVADAF